ncbi:hypothetical protein FIBSPDRAFT_886066 [Athelia psychrophila]|uniref:Uncharacterized protein n=1 Tax=Athelia psychrophila TaxID=1759441 RepID=A0A166R2J2_9AGAM|nr:hypothetical protein FIBSPDRAFT_886066 [Fibularhizoctonia sp. CBS 109695]
MWTHVASKVNDIPRKTEAVLLRTALWKIDEAKAALSTSILVVREFAIALVTENCKKIDLWRLSTRLWLLNSPIGTERQILQLNSPCTSSHRFLSRHDMEDNGLQPGMSHGPSLAKSTCSVYPGRRSLLTTYLA